MVFCSIAAIILLASGLSAAPIPLQAKSVLSSEAVSNLSAHHTWRRLLHYRTSWGAIESQADGRTFFLSREGKTDPAKELVAFVEAVQEPLGEDEDPNAHPICSFPARTKWLLEQGALRRETLPSIICPKYMEFISGTAGQSITLVFSAYYLNNPASAFGHTLLRINKAGAVARQGRRFELLDYGVNYAAIVTVDNPLLYGIYGMFGWFRGTFTRIPYFYKVREYNDYESRDMWDYDLNLSPAQVERVVDHIWELGNTYFDYYYFTENCSYHMMTVLDVALPREVSFADRLPKIIIPADTLKVLGDVPGLIRSVQYRPSLRVQFDKKVSLLSPDQRRRLLAVVNDRQMGERLADLSPNQKAEVLDAAVDHVDVHHFKELIQQGDSGPSAWKQELVVARSQIPVASELIRLEKPMEEAPHLGHDSRRFGVNLGVNQSGSPYVGLALRYALHDLLDPQIGYPEYAQIEFVHGKIRYWPKEGRLWLEDLTLFQVMSLTPWSVFDHKLSWWGKVSLQTERSESCENCSAGKVELGMGPAARWGESLTAFATLDMEAAIGPKFSRSWFRLGVGPRAGVRVRWTPTLLSLVTASYRYRFFSPAANWWEGAFETRYSPASQFSLGISGKRFGNQWETSVASYLFF